MRSTKEIWDSDGKLADFSVTGHRDEEDNQISIYQKGGVAVRLSKRDTIMLVVMLKDAIAYLDEVDSED